MKTLEEYLDFAKDIAKYAGKVMMKCGMKYEGTLRSSDWNNQGICDACYYALLKSER